LTKNPRRGRAKALPRQGAAEAAPGNDKQKKVRNNLRLRLTKGSSCDTLELVGKTHSTQWEKKMITQQEFWQTCREALKEIWDELAKETPEEEEE